LIVALASLGYEKTCVLFNCGALASQIAAEQNLDNDEGLKAAAKHYQVQRLPAYALEFGVINLKTSILQLHVFSSFNYNGGLADHMALAHAYLLVLKNFIPQQFPSAPSPKTAGN